ncbi:polysaccharide deacetylase family protein [Pseudonocardia nigra]|uniref:polysaccharide deacetylase family protein n=1 Tax=Pseudonocardia nigra TaxID=1921578 RepID=UPI001C5E3F02
MAWRRLIPAGIALLTVAGCAGGPLQSVFSSPDSGNAVEAPPPAPAPPVDPAEVQANELGSVPVLMYHRLVDDPVSVYDRTPEGFRAELERLAREGYVPVTTAEFAAGEMDIPAGKHPVVLTFDDGDPSTITIGPDNAPAEGTAVQILQQVAAANPGFRPVASMYVNADPFGGGAAGEKALRWLHENGFEVGNHTFGHTNLRLASAAEGEQDIARGDRFIREAVPGYEPTTLALPFGARPRDAESALRGSGYDYTGVLLVGANPAPSPYSEKFEPAAIPRIRSQGYDDDEAEYGSSVWLDELAANPESPYTSDGNPDVISYPAGSGSPADRFVTTAAAY